MAAARSLRNFHIALGIIAVGGVALILTQRQRGASVMATSQSAPVAPLPAGSAVGHKLGSDSAPVEIVEFADFACSHCAVFAIVEMPEIRERLIATGRLKWRFMDFPLGISANSPAAHLAAGCADEQGRFFEMMDVIFYRQNDWASERRPGRKLRDYAQQVGLDLGRFDTCVETKHAQPLVDADHAEGERFGVQATPTFVVNGRVWPSVLRYDDIKAIVDSLAPVAGAKGAAPPARR
jgi:protein-disulfide isomerase